MIGPLAAWEAELRREQFRREGTMRTLLSRAAVIGAHDGARLERGHRLEYSRATGLRSVQP